MATVGVRVSIDGDASGAVKALNDASNALSRLNDNAKNLPTFMGSQVPGSSSQPLPRLTPQPSPLAANPNGQTYLGTLLDSRGFRSPIGVPSRYHG
jgi:hypothetical protein